jgi:hypothetical protein
MAVAAVLAQAGARLPQCPDRIVAAVEVAIGVEQRAPRAVGAVDDPVQQR